MLARLLRQELQMQTAAKLRIRWDRYRLIAAPEVAAAIGLLIGYASAPFGAAAGIGLAVLMAGALFFRPRVHDSAGLFARRCCASRPGGGDRRSAAELGLIDDYG